jgi:hypothetical protein
MGKHAALIIPKPVMIAGALIALAAVLGLGASLVLERQRA